jgi:hypothetical protein
MYFNDITNILSTDFTDSLTWYLLKDVKATMGALVGSKYLFSLPYNDSLSLIDIKESDKQKYLDITKSGEVIGLGSITIKSTFQGIPSSMPRPIGYIQTNIILFKNDIYECKITKDFFVINTNVFEDISKEVNRDKKINKLIK